MGVTCRCYKSLRRLEEALRRRELLRAELLADTEREEAATAVERLTEYLRAARSTRAHLRLQAADGSSEIEATVPTAAIRLLVETLTELAQGNAVSITPVHAELTTQQAAELLNVSRPYLIKLLQQDRIPCRRVGNRRKIRLQDLLIYKRLDDEHRRKALTELTREAERLGLDY